MGKTIYDNMTAEELDRMKPYIHYRHKWVWPLCKMPNWMICLAVLFVFCPICIIVSVFEYTLQGAPFYGLYRAYEETCILWSKARNTID